MWSAAPQTTLWGGPPGPRFEPRKGDLVAETAAPPLKNDTLKGLTKLGMSNIVHIILQAQPIASLTELFLYRINLEKWNEGAAFPAIWTLYRRIPHTYQFIKSVRVHTRGELPEIFLTLADFLQQLLRGIRRGYTYRSVHVPNISSMDYSILPNNIEKSRTKGLLVDIQYTYRSDLEPPIPHYIIQLYTYIIFYEDQRLISGFMGQI